METVLKLTSRDNLDEVQLAMLHARVGRLQWMRSLTLLLVSAALFSLLHSDQATWRKWLVTGLAIFGVVQGIREYRNPRRNRFRRLATASAWRLPAILSGVFFLATGGIDSPLLPIVIMACFFAGTFAPPRGIVPTTLAFSAVICCLAFISWREVIPDLMPAVFGGGPRLPQPTALLWAKTGVLLFSVSYAAFVAAVVRDIFRQMIGDAFDARDEALQSHEEHVRELTTLSGELAHELKNPLANLKGLSVLVGRDVQGKGIERLEVLQREISRMEEILQSFLTFSRPLSPLSLEDVDLQFLCRSSAGLHEGLAQAKDITLKLLSPGPVRAVCDPRKIKQILINLLQNALDASPVGATVEIVLVNPSRGEIRVEVLDQGPGISPEVRSHLFEPGATTKEKGSGLGLVLARGLARQHGGELVVKDREGVGCSAILTFPVGPLLTLGEPK